MRELGLEGVVRGKGHLIAAIETWVAHWNHDPKPFGWHTPAAEVIEKVQRGRTTLHQIKSATTTRARQECCSRDRRYVAAVCCASQDGVSARV